MMDIFSIKKSSIPNAGYGLFKSNIEFDGTIPYTGFLFNHTYEALIFKTSRSDLLKCFLKIIIKFLRFSSVPDSEVSIYGPGLASYANHNEDFKNADLLLDDKNSNKIDLVLNNSKNVSNTEIFIDYGYPLPINGVE